MAEAIATYGGDVRAALRATLVANAYLEVEVDGLRTRTDAQATSASEDLDVRVTAFCRAAYLVVVTATDHFDISHVNGRDGNNGHHPPRGP